MDKSRLAAIVYERTGIALDPDDPAFALVEMNRLILEETVGQVSDRVAGHLGGLAERIQSSAQGLAVEVAVHGIGAVAKRAEEACRAVAADAEQAQRRIIEQAGHESRLLAQQVAAVERAAQPLSSRWRYAPTLLLVANAVIFLVSFGCGFLAGQDSVSPTPTRQSAGR